MCARCESRALRDLTTATPEEETRKRGPTAWTTGLRGASMRRALELAARRTGVASHPIPWSAPSWCVMAASWGRDGTRPPASPMPRSMALREAGLDAARGATVVLHLGTMRSHRAHRAVHAGPDPRGRRDAHAVVAATGDPNPLVDGAGFARLPRRRHRGGAPDRPRRGGSPAQRDLRTTRHDGTAVRDPEVGRDPRREDRRRRRHVPEAHPRGRQPAPTSSVLRGSAPTRSWSCCWDRHRRRPRPHRARPVDTAEIRRSASSVDASRSGPSRLPDLRPLGSDA